MAHRKGPRRKHKLEMREAREQHALVVLEKHNKDKKKNPRARTKRKTPTEIASILPHNVKKEWFDFKIRDPEEWVSKSYNIEKQITDFVKWTLCEYHVPRFMFDLFLPSRQSTRIDARSRNITFSEQDIKEFMSWIITIGQGYSFAKSVRDVFTKKEAHYFLNAPSENGVFGNIWWARCKARQIPDNITQFIVQRFTRISYTSPFWISFLDFIKNNEDELNVATLQELMDFLPPHHNSNENFSLKGRTLNSLIQLSNEWHREQQATKHGKFQIWDGFSITDWKYMDKKEKETWTVRQLHTSKELYAEGRSMRHCVYGYVRSCISGRAAIFTMESIDQINQKEKRLTIEVLGSRQISQAKGRLNRRPTARELNILHKWSVGNRLTIDSWITR